METEPSEADRSERERDRDDDLTEAPVETEGEPEHRLEESEPSDLEDPERHGSGPANGER